MADRSVKVVLSAQVQGYVDGMEKAARSTREVGSESEKLAQQREAFDQVGRSAIVMGGAMAVGLGMAAKAAVDWDSAWAGVTKTVDGNKGEMAELEGQLRSLAQTLPSTHEEIAAVAEAAGQLGIQRENVAGFTKTMIDLGQSTNLSAEEAATQLARFMNVMGTAQENVGRLGAALVSLGNNYATTESEILAMAQRLSGAGKQINMSEGQVLGLSTALSSVGIEAEAGGSAMSKVMIDIASSVDKGGDRLKLFADVAGMSAQDFAAKWKKDPGEALAAFVSGLANTEAQGKSTFAVLEELGITEVRMRDALLRSSAAADQFSAAMKQGDQAIAEGTALTEEANKRYETTAAQLGIMRNKVIDAAITLGQQLLPSIEAVADGIGNFASMIGDMDGPMAYAIVQGGILAAGILLTGGVALAAVPKIAAYKVALETLGITGASARGKLASIGSFLTGPWGLALAAAATAAHAFKVGLEDGRASATKLESALLNSANSADVLKTAFAQSDAAKFWIGDYASELKDLGDLLDRTNGYAEGWVWMEGFGDQEMITRIGSVGKALATVAETDVRTAQEKFAELAKSYKLSDEQAASMLDRMPEFRDSLIKVADGMGIASDDSNLLKIALGEIGPAAGDSASTAQSAADAYLEQGQSAADAADQLRQLVDTMNEYNGVGQSAEEANARYQQSLADVAEYIQKANEGAEGYSLSMDENTQVGSANRAMLAGLAADSQSAAQKMLEQEMGTLGAAKATENFSNRLQAGRDNLIKTAMQFGLSEAAAKAFADRVAKIPTKKELKVIADTAKAAADLDAIANKPRKAVIQTILSGPEAGNVVYSGAGGRQVKADGGMIQYADGGVAEYANGGLNPGIYSGGTPIVKFAEPETRWEAFISGKPGKEARNREVWVEAGRRLGIDATPNVTNNFDWSITLQSTGSTQSDIELIDRELRARRAQGGF